LRSFENRSISGHKVQALVDGPICDVFNSKGHKGLLDVCQPSHKGIVPIGIRPILSTQSPSGLSKILGLAWKRSVGAAPVLGAPLYADRKLFFAKMAGRGLRGTEQGFGAGAGSGSGQQLRPGSSGLGGAAAPSNQFRGNEGSFGQGGGSNMQQSQLGHGNNSGFVPPNNNFIPRNDRQGFAPQGNTGNGSMNANAGTGRGSYGLPPHMLRRSNNNQGSGEASDFMEVDMSQNNSQQSGFDGFSSNFGDFDEGYYDNNQNLSQGHDGYGYGNQRYRNNYKQGSYGGRG
jgi:hypothetical protein